MNKLADLHIHTNFSDSTLTPEEVVEEAKKYGIYCIAITDHDTIQGISPAINAAKEYGIEIIAGVELSCEIGNRDIHILGYCFDIKNSRMLEQFICMQDVRVLRMKKMIDKLKSFGMNNIELAEVCALSESQSVGRPHLALILKEKGWVASTKEAFDKYISDDGPAYVKKFKQTPQEGIALIKQAGGVAVLAHPMVTNVDELIPSFVDAGLDGIEAYYPNSSNTIQDFYVNLAKKNGLLVTGGSDAHGKAKYNTYIGKITVPYELVEKLKNRAKEYYKVK